MFFGDQKKNIMTIVGKRDKMGNRTMEPTSMKPEEVRHEDGTPDGRHAAMEDFMAAHREGSAMKMAEAMKNFMDIHMSISDEGTGEPKAE
jgi:hypothetical protein